MSATITCPGRCAILEWLFSNKSFLPTSKLRTRRSGRLASKPLPPKVCSSDPQTTCTPVPSLPGSPRYRPRLVAEEKASLPSEDRLEDAPTPSPTTAEQSALPPPSSKLGMAASILRIELVLARQERFQSRCGKDVGGEEDLEGAVQGTGKAGDCLEGRSRRSVAEELGRTTRCQAGQSSRGRRKRVARNRGDVLGPWGRWLLWM